MTDDLAGVFASGWHRLRTRDDAPSNLRLDRVARLGRSGQLDIVEILEGPRVDDDDVTHLANSPGTRAALQNLAGETRSMGPLTPRPYPGLCGATSKSGDFSPFEPVPRPPLLHPALIRRAPEHAAPRIIPVIRLPQHRRRTITGSVSRTRVTSATVKMIQVPRLTRHDRQSTPTTHRTARCDNRCQPRTQRPMMTAVQCAIRHNPRQNTASRSAETLPVTTRRKLPPTLIATLHDLTPRNRGEKPKSPGVSGFSRCRDPAPYLPARSHNCASSSVACICDTHLQLRHQQTPLR
jgi:hypothetical protein